MSNNRDNNYISVLNWMWMMFITAIPIIGLIMMIIWAFTGENESRKNYFRAIFAWLLLFIAMFVALVLLGTAPAVLQKFHSLTHKA